MGIETLIANAAAIVIPLFSDLCTITDLKYTNDGAGGSIEDPTSVSISGIPCVFEPLRNYPRFQQLPGSQILTQEATHLVIMELTSSTVGIRSNYRITIAPRSPRPALIFEQPQRLDEDMSPVILVACILRNQ